MSPTTDDADAVKTALPAASRAFLAAMITALVADGLLAALTSAVNVARPSASAPWWVEAHLVERGRWIVLAVLLVIVGARRAATTPAPAADANRKVWRLVGGAVIAIPLLWMLASWIVQAVLVTLAGRWDIDGRVFLALGYYRRLFTDYVPWLAGGAATLAMSRHLSDA